MSNPYFTHLEVSFFTVELLFEIDSVAQSILNSHLSSPNSKLEPYDYTEHTNLYFISHVEDRIKSLTKLTSSCREEVVGRPMLAYTPPNKEIGIHRDEYGCKTKLILPILPLEQGQPLQFFKSLDSTSPIHEVFPTRHRPLLFDADCPHGVPADPNSWRISLQLMFKNSFSHISSLAQRNELFFVHQPNGL